jgi:hypothetical protein
MFFELNQFLFREGSDSLPLNWINLLISGLSGL